MARPRIRPSRRLVALCVLALPAIAAAGEGARDLRPGWKAGQGATYRLWVKRKRVHRFEGAAPPGAPARQTLTFRLQGRIAWRVRAVGDFGSRCRMRIRGLQARLTTPDGATHRIPGGSGGHPAAKQIGQLIDALNGAEIGVELSPAGTVTGISGHKAVIEASGGHFSKREFREMASRVAAVPEAPAKARPGAAWRHTLVGKRSMGSLEQRMTYRFDGVRRIAGIPVATIETSAKLNFTVDQSKLPKKGPRLDVRMTAASRSGRILFDLARGEVVGRHAREQRTLEMRMHLPQKTITQVIETTSMRQLLRVDERAP